MNRIFKPFSLLALVMSFVFCFAGCGETTSAVFDESSFRFKVQGEELESEVMAENGEFSLYWDAERAAVCLKTRYTEAHERAGYLNLPPHPKAEHSL